MRSIPYGDKLGHISLFGILSLIIILSTKGKSFSAGKLNIYCGALIVFMFALTEEISQAFISSRTFDTTDLVADIIGISLSAAICRVFFSRKKEANP
ncbi:hypothetical protein GL2_18890 [Microbulbifer sp. GL-2]|nr:hypothetical protein GL2_18890 [Microbulbifer sp. GL-2]